MKQVYIPDQDYEVLVITITYNQSKYILATLEGVAMQQTSFPFVHYVIDDASTDGEQEVIRKWLLENCDMDKAKFIDLELADVILVNHKTNTNCLFAIYLLKRNLWKEPALKETLITPWVEHCKYEAYCEGDDYWIDSLKLQKQYDFLESHPNHSLCFHSNQICSSDGENIGEYRAYSQNIESVPMHDIIMGGGSFMATNSMFYVRKKLMHYPWMQNLPVGDIPWMLSLAVNGQVGYLDDVMSCYRKASLGSWTEQMSKSWAMQKNNHYKLEKMWFDFDDFTQKKYHKSVMKKIWRNRLSFYHIFINRLIHFNF